MAPKNDTATDARRRLVIVESPAKAKTIAGYLGQGYVVESSIGHVRDLPTRAAEIPAKYKKESWARLGVDVEHGFEPLYVINSDKKDQVRKLKELLSDADELYLATDEDREGEAIAWHLKEVLNPRVPIRRMVFHEITRDAIQRAVEQPRDIDEKLVDAQETRRVVDRLYGYEISPVLWKKVMPKLSAGRVQSVATRLVVQRERERIAFRAAQYWDLEGTFLPGGDGDGSAFAATLAQVDGRRVAAGRDFGPDGALRGSDVVHLDEEGARGLADRLTGAAFEVRGIERKPYRRSPYAPFRTTTLQQEASRKLGFGAKRTMQVAQRLYENGHITYMRTDSITLSEAAITAARSQARELYGQDYVPDAPRVYQSKVKNAQEAHEAIRPTGDTFATPAETGLTSDDFRLYELIWKRTVASQMRDATGQSVTVRVGGRSTAGEDAELSATGKVISFHGFLRAYVEGSDDPEAELDDRERKLPPLEEGQALAADAIEPREHATRPPARYTEATLVRELEEREIGRPSTYANIIGTILDRGYVFKKSSALVPSFLAFAVVGLLEGHFEQLVDYGFTARMEEGLDDIARGEIQSAPWLSEFYFGDSDGEEGLRELVSDLGEIDAREVNSFPIDDTDIVVRVGRYGTYLQRGDERANVPDDIAPDELTVGRAEELLAAPSGDRELGAHPETGRPVVAKHGRYGPYVAEMPPEDPSGSGRSSKSKSGSKATKPRTASLLSWMSQDTVTLDEAVSLLSLPRVVGALDGEEVTAQNGRYGPYLKKGADSRSLDSEEQIFSISLAEAKELFAQPKRRGRRAASEPLRELGADPDTGKQVVVKNGRFGPYVTDGETNASLRTGDSADTVELERAAALLAERRAKGSTSKSGGSKSGGGKSGGSKSGGGKSGGSKSGGGKSGGSKSRSSNKSKTTSQ